MIEISKIERDWDQRSVEYLRFETPDWCMIIETEDEIVSVDVTAGSGHVIFDGVKMSDDGLEKVWLNTGKLPPRTAKDIAETILYIWRTNV
jgi:hypothetical protein